MTYRSVIEDFNQLCFTLEFLVEIEQSIVKIRLDSGLIGYAAHQSQSVGFSKCGLPYLHKLVTCMASIYTSSSAPMANLVGQVLRILRPNFNVLWPTIIWSFLAIVWLSSHPVHARCCSSAKT